MESLNKNTLGRIESVLDNSKEDIILFIIGIDNNIKNIQYYGNLYSDSCKKIKTLNGEKETGQNVLWDDINKALALTCKFKSEDINIIKASWEKMQSKSFSQFNNLYDALSELVRWTSNEETRIRNDLEKVWLADTQKQKTDENNYLSAVKDFFSGTGDINSLKEAAEKAYEKNYAKQRNHFDNIHTALINDFSAYLTMGKNHYSEFSSLAYDIQLLTEKTIENRYAAELAAREIEWNQMRADISGKSK